MERDLCCCARRSGSDETVVKSLLEYTCTDSSIPASLNYLSTLKAVLDGPVHAVWSAAFKNKGIRDGFLLRECAA